MSTGDREAAAAGAILRSAQAVITARMGTALKFAVATRDAANARRKVRSVIPVTLGAAVAQLPVTPRRLTTAVLTAQQDAGRAFDAALHASLGSPPPPGPWRKVAGKASGRTRLEAGEHVLRQLAERGLTGFTDAAGRRRDLASYAETVTRIAVRQQAERAKPRKPALHIPSLEGTWKTIFDRRAALQSGHAAAVTAAWQAALPSARPVIRRYRALPGQGKAAAETVAGQWLEGVFASPRYPALLAAVTAALSAAAAEGKAGALAAGAEHHGAAGLFSFRAAYDSFRRQEPAYPVLLTLSAQQAIRWMISGTARDVGRELARLAALGADEAAMAGAVAGIIAAARAVAWSLGSALSQAMSRAALALYQSAGVDEVNWITAGDASVCPACQQEEDGNPYPAYDVDSPPLHNNCVIGSTRVAVPGLVVPGDEPDRLPSELPPLVTGYLRDGSQGTASAVAVAERDFGRGNIRAATVREYVGDVITIRTASGKELTATPNHPVATRSGWVPVAKLAVGDHVLISTGPEWEEGSVDPDVDHIPPCIEQVAETLPVLADAVPTAAEDFHGDGAGSDICVVRTDRLLLDHVKPRRAQRVCERHLGRRDVPVSEALAGASPFHPLLDGLLAAGDGLMRGAGEPGTFPGTGLGHPGVHALAAIPGPDSGLEQAPPYNPAVDAEGFCERLLALAGGIAPDEVIDIKRDVLATHVYNLETANGWYVGNGIVTHNCRCVIDASGSVPWSALAGYLS